MVLPLRAEERSPFAMNMAKSYLKSELLLTVRKEAIAVT